MFSHVVIFWTDPNLPGAADELIAAANECLIRILHTRLNPFINTGALARCRDALLTRKLFQQFVNSCGEAVETAQVSRRIGTPC